MILGPPLSTYYWWSRQRDCPFVQFEEAVCSGLPEPY